MDTIITFIFGIVTALILIGVIFAVRQLNALNQKIEDLQDDIEEQENALEQLEQDITREVQQLYDTAIEQINQRFNNQG